MGSARCFPWVCLHGVIDSHEIMKRWPRIDEQLLQSALKLVSAMRLPLEGKQSATGRRVSRFPEQSVNRDQDSVLQYWRQHLSDMCLRNDCHRNCLKNGDGHRHFEGVLFSAAVGLCAGLATTTWWIVMYLLHHLVDSSILHGNDMMQLLSRNEVIRLYPIHKADSSMLHFTCEL